MIRIPHVLVVLCLGSGLMLPAHATAGNEASVGASSPDSVPAPRASRLGPESPGYRFPSGREQLEAWALSAFGPSAVAGSAVSAAWGQWVTDEPAEWPGDGRGFAKRFGAASATTAITETSLSLLSAATRQDTRYYRCPCTGLGPRIAYSIKLTFMARGPEPSARVRPEGSRMVMDTALGASGRPWRGHAPGFAARPSHLCHTARLR